MGTRIHLLQLHVVLTRLHLDLDALYSICWLQGIIFEVRFTTLSCSISSQIAELSLQVSHPFQNTPYDVRLPSILQ